MGIVGSHSDYRFAPGIKRPSRGISGASAWPDDVQLHARMQFIAAMLLLAVLATGGLAHIQRAAWGQDAIPFFFR